MSLKEFHILEQESVQHTRTRTRPVLAGPDAYVPGGDTEEYNYTGPWEALLARFNGLEGTLTRRLQATLTRNADGLFGELNVTYTTYIPGKDATNADPDGSMPGSSRAQPCYDLTTSEASAPIMTHPDFAKISGEGARAMKMLIEGYASEDMFDETRTIGEVAEGADQKLYALVCKGVTEYLVQRVTLTARYKASSTGEVGGGMEVKAPPGPFANVGGGRDWLYLGATQNISNGEIWVTETYKLSGPGGWEKSLY